MLHLVGDHIVDHHMRQQKRPDGPERPHMLGILMPPMRFFAGERLGQQNPVRMLGHRHKLDIETVRIKPALFQMILRRPQIGLALSGLGGKETDDAFHGILPRFLARWGVSAEFASKASLKDLPELPVRFGKIKSHRRLIDVRVPP